MCPNRRGLGTVKIGSISHEQDDGGNHPEPRLRCFVSTLGDEIEVKSLNRSFTGFFVRDRIGMIAALVCDGGEDHRGALPVVEARGRSLPGHTRALRGPSDPVSVPMSSSVGCRNQKRIT